jgi:hypothetical protein
MLLDDSTKKTLEDGMCLSDYNIQDGCKITLIWRNIQTIAQYNQLKSSNSKKKLTTEFFSKLNEGVSYTADDIRKLYLKASIDAPKEVICLPEETFKKEGEEDKLDDDEFKCEICSTIQGFNTCELCDTTNVCVKCYGEGDGPNEIGFRYRPTCLKCYQDFNWSIIPTQVEKEEAAPN